MLASLNRWRALLIYGMAYIIMAMLFVYVGYAIDENNRRWCSTLSDLTPVDPRTLPQPSTELGIANRPTEIITYDALRTRMDDFGCFKRK